MRITSKETYVACRAGLWDQFRIVLNDRNAPRLHAPFERHFMEPMPENERAHRKNPWSPHSKPRQGGFRLAA
jgi:hypothetical protein